MLTKLYNKSSFLLIVFSNLFLACIIYFKVIENYNSPLTQGKLYYLFFFVALIGFYNYLNSFMINQSASKDFNVLERSSIHLFIFPAVLSFMPHEIINFRWIIGALLLFMAFTKFLKTPDLDKESLLKIGIQMSVSIILIPYFFAYTILIIILFIPIGKFKLSNLFVVIMPIVVSGSLALTIKAFFLIDVAFYEFLNKKENFYFLDAKGLEGKFLIILVFTSVLTFVFAKTIELSKLERNSHYSRIGIFATHLILVYFINKQEAMILILPSTVYGLSLFHRRLKKTLFAEAFLLVLLFFSIFNTFPFLFP